MKKILLLLAFVMTMGIVNAKTDKFACNQTLTSPVVWTGSSNEVKLFDDLASVDKGKYKNLHIKISNKSNISYVQVRIMCNGNYGTASWHKDYYSSTDITIDLTAQTYKDENATATARTYSDISRIYLKAFSSDASAVASYQIDTNDVYLESDEYENMGIISTLNSSTTSTSPFQWYTSSDGTTKTNATGGFYKKQFGMAGIKEILAKAGSSLGYGNGFFDITGYDNVTVNIDSYDNTKDSQLRLLQATESSSTTNFDIDVTKAGATTKSLSTLSKRWIAGVYTKSGSSNSQAITSIAFSKDFKATSETPFNIAASSSSTVNYDRAFTAGKKYTICLPFALTADEVSAAGEFYELNSVSDDVLNFTTVTETVAYKPYIFVPSSTGAPFANLSAREIAASSGATTTTKIGSYTFKGVLAASSNVKGDNGDLDVYGFSAADGKFVKVTGNSVSIKAFRAYIVPTVAESRGFIDTNFGDGTTAIKKVETVSDDDPNAPVYNLAGQQVDASYKGIVIKNGKKYIQNK